MMNTDEIKNTIWDVMQDLRGLIFSSDKVSNSVVRLFFLKYAVDNNIGATSLETMQQCAKAQKMFALRDTETGLETIVPFLKNIDRAYHLDKIISSSDVIEQYAGELFGMDRSRQKKNTNDQGFKRIMDKLGSLDLEEVQGSHELGKLLVDALISVVISSTEGNRFIGEHTTNPSLSKLAGAILEVNATDTFCDSFSGKAVSTIIITGNTLPDVTLVEISRENAAISAMLLIMYGYEHFKIICSDSLTEQLPGVRGNKMFIDPPVGMKVEKTEENKYIDGNLAAIDSIMHRYLSQHGVAVVTTPSGPLFRQGPAAALKEELTMRGLLQAVIALPPMWTGSNVGTNLLVLGENLKRGILFVDASDRAVASDKKRYRGSATLSDETIREITELIHNPHDVPGFAKVASWEVISRMGFNLIPANYVVKQMEEDTTTLEEIDAELAALYRQLSM